METLNDIITLSIRFNISYVLWAIIESSTDFWGSTGWLNKLAMTKMNKISMEKRGKTVFSYDPKK